MEKKITLFITEQDSTIKVRGERVVVSKKDEQLVDVPLIHLREIVVFGNASITPAAVSRILNVGVSLVFLSKYGRFKGILLPALHSDGIIRLKQSAKFHDEKFKLQFSREVVKAKISNSISVLEKKRRRKVDVTDEKAKLINMKESVEKATSLKELRGIEGVSARLYYSALSKIFREEFPFTGREKHPSPDPLNSLLSLSYSLLYSICFSFLHTAGLDPFLGFFHEIRRGHASLASDLCEEFRAPICDALVIRMVNQGYFSANSFVSEGTQVFLQKDALKLFLREWASHLDSRVKVNGAFETTRWHLIRHQAQLLRKAVIEDCEYTPYREDKDEE